MDILEKILTTFDVSERRITFKGLKLVCFFM